APAGRSERRARHRQPARGGGQRGRHAPGAGRSGLDPLAARADVDGLDGRRNARRNSTLPAGAGYESSRPGETRTRPCEPETTNTTCVFPLAVITTRRSRRLRLRQEASEIPLINVD